MATVPFLSSPYKSWSGVILMSLATAFILHKHKIRGDTGFLLILLGLCAATLNDINSGMPFGAAVLHSLLFIFSHIATIAFITVSYRVSPFHPLWSVPGPLLNKATGIFNAYLVSTGKRHVIVNRLHSQYGDFVRTGPNTVSINSLDAVGQIYAQGECMDKTDGYLLGRSQHAGLFFMPKREDHNVRRHAWASAFTPNAIMEYRQVIERRARLLARCIEDRRDNDSVIDLGEAFQHWSYDVMGDVVFGGSNRLELMNDGDPHQYVKCGQLATAAFEILGEVPWLFDLLWYLPMTQDIHALERFAGKLMEVRRRDTNGPHKDVCASLLGERTQTQTTLTDGELTADALFAIQAGSDSTSSVLTFLFFFLLSNPEKYAHLQAEIDKALAGKDFTSAAISSLPYLNAVIDESLRLGTPFPGLPRVVPPGGAILHNRHIPGGTTVAVPAYSQQVSPDNFSPAPLEFIPERWLEGGLGPGSVCRRSAIMCFSFGPFSCMGKNFAIQELRATAAYLLWTLDFAFAPDFRADEFIPNVSGVRTTLFGKSLRVSVRSRSRC